MAKLVHKGTAFPATVLMVKAVNKTAHFTMPQLQTKCGERAFSHVGPAA